MGLHSETLSRWEGRVSGVVLRQPQLSNQQSHVVTELLKQVEVELLSTITSCLGMEPISVSRTPCSVEQCQDPTETAKAGLGDCGGNGWEGGL